MRRQDQKPKGSHSPIAGVVQRAASVQKKGPVAPPVYRPQPVPKVLQTKKANGPQSNSRSVGSVGRVQQQSPVQTIRKPISVPVYRPQPVPKVLQTRKSNSVRPHLTPHAPVIGKRVIAGANAIQRATSPHQSLGRPSAPGFPSVIQKKGPLTIVNTKELEPNSKVRAELLEDYRQSRYVDMEWRGVTNGEPLYTDAVQNCLGVVIHNRDRDYGALMHIFPGTVGGYDHETLFYSVNQELKKVATWNAYKGGELELLLWKGISWAPMSHKKSLNENFSYAEYLAKKQKGRFAKVIDLLDKTSFTLDSAMLYVPRKGTVYIIDDATESELKSQKKHTESVADANFEQIEHRDSGYYKKLQQYKASKREEIERLIEKFQSLSPSELRKLLDENRGHTASEELERAAIHLLSVKENPKLKNSFPKIHTPFALYPNRKDFRLRGRRRPSKLTLLPPQKVTPTEMKKIDHEAWGSTFPPEGCTAPSYQLRIDKGHLGFYVVCEVMSQAFIGKVRSYYTGEGTCVERRPTQSLPGRLEVITAKYSQSAFMSEMEHLNDVIFAYQITLDAVQNVLRDLEIGPFASEEEAGEYLKHFDAIFESCLNQYLSTYFRISDKAHCLGHTPEEWLKCFRTTCELTRLRDVWQWHDSQVENANEFAEISSDNFLKLVLDDGPKVPKSRTVKSSQLITLGLTFEEGKHLRF